MKYLILAFPIAWFVCLFICFAVYVIAYARHLMRNLKPFEADLR